MEHNCRLKKEKLPKDKFKWYQKFRLISLDNPLRLSYFRSDTSVREEQIRHLKMNNNVIHPFSKLKAWYDMYLIYLYSSVLITKPFDAGFTQSVDCTNLNFYIGYNIIMDGLCWLDIIINFFTGYELHQIQTIELRNWHIAKRYMFGPYFICDVLSSIPKCLIYIVAITKFDWSWRLGTAGIASILGLFKGIRIVSFVKCIWRTADYFHLASRGMLSLICTLFGSLMIVHWLACMQFAVPRLYRINFAGTLQNTSWFYSPKLYNGTLYTEQSLLTRYNNCFFKCSAYILGIRIILYDLEMPEEYILAIVTYFIGKILIGFIWIILAVAILNGRIMELKFAEIINQLQEYMVQKQLPVNLQSRIFQHFNFKYQNKYFQEELITSLLSENLKHEATMHTCKSLINNVSLFRELSLIEISKVVQCLLPEIFLPNDIVIHAGTQGDAMYFIASGTVAVYTRSGREICHLQDGAYFGEISLVIKGQLRSTTVIALETSYVYRLNKKDLERCLLSNKTVLFKILRNAEERLKEATKLEEEYKEHMLEQSLRTMSRVFLNK